MSRTKRGGKPCGQEYWSKRPGTRGACTPGAESKQYNNRLERRKEDAKLRKEIKENIDG